MRLSYIFLKSYRWERDSNPDSLAPEAIYFVLSLICSTRNCADVRAGPALSNALVTIHCDVA